jgi:hypothetical protein
MNDPDIQEDDLKRRQYEYFRFLNDKTSKEYFSVKRDIRLLIKNKALYMIAPPENAEEDDPFGHLENIIITTLGVGHEGEDDDVLSEQA